jgi:hypothetical protein
MKNSTSGLRYIAYIRKSEEREDRQALSHPAQIARIKEQFKGLNIVKWLEPESKSAFKPGRPIDFSRNPILKDLPSPCTI